jgi:hypothetical protein
LPIPRWWLSTPTRNPSRRLPRVLVGANGCPSPTPMPPLARRRRALSPWVGERRLCLRGPVATGGAAVTVVHSGRGVSWPTHGTPPTLLLRLPLHTQRGSASSSSTRPGSPRSQTRTAFAKPTAAVAGVAGPPPPCLGWCRRTLLACASTVWRTTTSRPIVRFHRAAALAVVRATGRVTDHRAWPPRWVARGGVHLLAWVAAVVRSGGGSPRTACVRPVATRFWVTRSPWAGLHLFHAAARLLAPTLSLGRRRRSFNTLSLIWRLP